MSGLFYTWDSIHRIQGDESERILDCLYKMFLQLLKYGDLTVLSKIPKEMKSYIISYINIPFQHMQKMISSSYRSVSQVSDSALQDHCPAHGGVHQAPAGVDKVWRGLCVYQLVGDISTGGHAAHRPRVGLTPGICKVK